MAVLSLAGGQYQVGYSAATTAQTPEGAYTAWASALGVSATETLQALSQDDMAYAVTLGAPVFPLGPATAMFSTEAGLGLYQTLSPGLMALQYGISNISRMYGLITRPTLLLSFHPPSDLKSFEAKVQRSGTTTIIYSKYSNYNNESTYLYHAAIRIDGASIELIGKAVTDATPLYWTELVEDNNDTTTVVQQVAIATQAAGETWQLLAAFGAQGLMAAPTPLAAPAGVVKVAPVGALAGPRLLQAPVGVVQVRPQGWLEVAGLLQAPAGVAQLRPQGLAEVSGLLQPPAGVVQVVTAGLATMPSVLQAARVWATHDFTGQLGDAVSRYVMDLVTPGGQVRVPISSWQATLRTAGSNYVQCVVPAVLDWVGSISAATEFVISRRVVLPDGQAIEYVMARSPLEQTSFDRGSLNYTATLSGYAAVIGSPVEAPSAALDRVLSGVRSISQYGSGLRARCGIDWLLRPGHRAWLDEGTSFVVDYINYYALKADQFMDCGGA